MDIDRNRSKPLSEKELIDTLNGKLDRNVFYIILIPTISAVVASIIGLYILYYSGLTDLKVDMGVVKYKLDQLTTELQKHETATQK
jgi:hypothetical protein